MKNARIITSFLLLLFAGMFIIHVVVSSKSLASSKKAATATALNGLAGSAEVTFRIAVDKSQLLLINIPLHIIEFLTIMIFILIFEM